MGNEVVAKRVKGFPKSPKNGGFMKKALVVMILAVAGISAAFASCPPGRPYGCRQGIDGKVICGCGY